MIYKKKTKRDKHIVVLSSRNSKLITMKSLLSLLVFSVAVSQISAAKLNVTVFYETLCPDCVSLFRNQIFPTFQDASIRDKVYIELVPFGKASYTENPWRITCQHGPPECLGNVMNACFMARNSDNYKQVAFVSCCLSDSYPPNAGEKCAKKLGYSYEGVKECTTNKEGIALQIKHGRRTLDFKPKITFIPTIVYDNVYNDRDQRESLYNFRGVVTRKLKAKGINIEE